MSRSERKKVERKSPEQRLAELRAAARAIAIEDGLPAITLRSVGARVGVAPALVAHYQPNMEALVAGTFSDIVLGEIDEVAALISATSTPSDRMRVLIGTLLDGSRDDVTAVWVDAWSVGRRSEQLADAVRAAMDAWHALVMDVLLSGVAAGEFATAEPDEIAWQLLGMVDGINSQALVGYRPGQGGGRVIARSMERELGLADGVLSQFAPQRES